MNKHFLKKIRDNIPEPMKYILSPFFRNKLIRNNEYLKYTKLLQEKQNWSQDRIRSIQFNKLKEILIHSYETVPFYKKIFNEYGFNPFEFQDFDEIKVLPYLTKQSIRENFNNLISSKKVSGGYYTAITGGTTGEPLKVLLDYNCVFKENAFVDYFRKKIGYQIGDRLVTFRGIEFGDRIWKFNPMQNEHLFSPFRLSHQTIHDYVQKINSIKPSFLNGYLSSLYYFAKLMEEKNLELKYSIKGVFLISENINKFQREFVEDFFSVQTKTFYGHSERCIIAEEITQYRYKFNPFYGYTELLPNEDNSFSIVGTGFLNKTMPLIRYKTDDIGFSSEDNNSYFRILGKRKSTEGLYGINGEFFGHAAFNFHSEIFKNVTNYQFVQKVQGEAELLLIVNSRFHLSEIAQMKNEIAMKTKGVMIFHIKIVNKLILSGRGKYRMFISNIKDSIIE